jgi:hypothetical protein
LVAPPPPAPPVFFFLDFFFFFFAAPPGFSNFLPQKRRYQLHQEFLQPRQPILRLPAFPVCLFSPPLQSASPTI